MILFFIMLLYYQTFLFQFHPIIYYFNFRLFHYSLNIVIFLPVYFKLICLKIIFIFCEVIGVICIYFRRCWLICWSGRRNFFVDFICRCFFIKLFSLFHRSNECFSLISVWFIFIDVYLNFKIMMSYRLMIILLFLIGFRGFIFGMYEFDGIETCLSMFSSNMIILYVIFISFCFFILHKYFNEAFIFRTIIFQFRIYVVHLKYCTLHTIRIDGIDLTRYFT